MRQRTYDVVAQAIQDLNEELEYDSFRQLADDTPVFGTIDGIDSLSLVTLVVDLEGAVERTFGQRLVLADEKAMSMRNSPYRTVGSLTDFIVAKLEGGRG